MNQRKLHLLVSIIIFLIKGVSNDGTKYLELADSSEKEVSTGYIDGGKEKNRDQSKKYQNFPQNLTCLFKSGDFKQTILIPNEKDRMTLVQTRYGFSMYVDNTDQGVSGSISRQGTFAPYHIYLIGNILKPGMNILNLGSQTGMQALVMGKIIGEKGKIFIFQPYDLSNAILTKNIQINGMKQKTTIFKKGASDKTGVATYRLDKLNTGASNIIQEGNNNQLDEEKYKYFTVEMLPVDDALPTDISIDFALLDVEKMEVQALNGMRKVIQRSPNLVLMVEWQYLNNKKHDTDKTLSVLNFFASRGYKFYKYFGNNWNWACKLSRFSEVTSQQMLEIQFRDIFFFPSTVPLPSGIIDRNQTIKIVLAIIVLAVIGVFGLLFAKRIIKQRREEEIIKKNAQTEKYTFQELPSMTSEEQN